MSALTCHAEYKLLSVSTIPQMPSSSVAYSTFSWPGLLKHLRQMLISNSKMEEGKFSQDGINVSIKACLIKMSLKSSRLGISGKLWNTFLFVPCQV